MTNVTPITDKAPQAVAKFSITATIDGFPITVEVEGKAEDLRALVGRLKAIGAQPPSLFKNSRPGKTEQTDDAPVCQYHGAMKASTARPGSFFCPKKMGDGSYCKSKA